MVKCTYRILILTRMFLIIKYFLEIHVCRFDSYGAYVRFGVIEEPLFIKLIDLYEKKVKS